MRIRCGTVLGTTIAIASGFAAPANGGITGNLFLTSGSSGRVLVMQGSSVSATWDAVGGCEAIAVDTSVRLQGSSADGQPGREYDLNGAVSNTAYPWAPGPSSLGDGTTDGVNFNYSIEGSDVWRFDRHWADPVRVMTLPTRAYGITYDTVNGTLWVSRRIGHGQISGIVEQYLPSGGEPLSAFASMGVYYALAYNPATDTMWGLESDPDVPISGMLREFNKIGAGLDEVSIDVEGYEIDRIHGGEFAIPTPGTAALGFVGLTLLCWRRSR